MRKITKKSKRGRVKKTVDVATVNVATTVKDKSIQEPQEDKKPPTISKGNEQSCPECGMINLKNRMTCIGCGISMYRGETQIKESRLHPKAKIKANGPKPVNICPCCGRITASHKSFFVPGHDGKVKGIFVKILKGGMKIGDLNKEMTTLYEKWMIAGSPPTLKNIMK